MSCRQASGTEWLMPDRPRTSEPGSSRPTWRPSATGSPAGAAAAEACAAGAHTVVFDRADGWDRACAPASGFVYLGGGTAVQKACRSR
jgi:3-oxo-5alpha-steroid 4-dehydrogenase